MEAQDGCILCFLTRSLVPEKREDRGPWHMTLSHKKEIDLLDISQAQQEGKHFKSMHTKQSLPRCSTKPSEYAKQRTQEPQLPLDSFSHSSTCKEFDLPPRSLLKCQLPNPSGSTVCILYWAANKTATWPVSVPIRP